MASALLIIKHTFFVVIIIGAGFAVERLTKIKWLKPMSEPLVQDDLVYNASSHLVYKNFDMKENLKKHYLMCLTNPTKPFCLLSANKRVEIFQRDLGGVPNAEVIESRIENINSDLQPLRLQLHSMLVTFTGFMKNYGIKVILIEPFVLFCLLSSDMKFGMLKKGFNPTRSQGSRNVVTVGILDEDSKNLEQANLTNEVLSAGFKVMKFRKWIGHGSKRSYEIAHYFFIQRDIAVHAVVFFHQNSYLWHSSLEAEGVDSKDLLFVKDGIFESFVLIPLNLEGSSMSRMFLPHDIRYFLQDVESSRLVECTSTSSNVISLLKHPSLTEEQLNKRAEITLKELKAVLAPEIVFFWLWSKTLLGWFANCDIFHYSTTLELAVANISTQGLNISDLFADSEFLTIENSTELDSDFQYKMNCHGLDINLFILHEDKDILTYQQGPNTTKLELPEFPMCSTHVFGQKTHVPCNADEILRLEFKKVYEYSIFTGMENKTTFSAETRD